MFTGTKIGTREYRGLGQDGSVFDIDVNRDLIRGPEGEPMGIVFIVRDVTARKQTRTSGRLDLAKHLKDLGRQIGGSLEVGPGPGARFDVKFHAAAG